MERCQVPAASSLKTVPLPNAPPSAGCAIEAAVGRLDYPRDGSRSRRSPLKLWSVVSVPAASSLKSVPMPNAPPLRSCRKSCHPRTLDHSPVRILAVAASGKVIRRGERSGRVELVHDAEAGCATLRGCAVKTAIGGLDQLRIEIAIAAAETMERRQRARRIELEERAAVERASTPWSYRKSCRRWLGSRPRRDSPLRCCRP